MQKSLQAICVFLAVFMCHIAIVAGETLAEVEKILTDKLEKIKAMRWEAANEGESEFEKFSGTMNFEMIRDKDGKTKMRMENNSTNTITGGNNQTPRNHNMRGINDGEFQYVDVWFNVPGGREGIPVHKYRADHVKVMGAPGKELFAKLRKLGELSLQAPEKLNDKDMYVIRLSFTGKANELTTIWTVPGLTEAKIYFDKETGMLAKFESPNPKGNPPKQSLLFKNIKTDVTIAPERFVRNTDGEQVFDLTKEK